MAEHKKLHMAGELFSLLLVPGLLFLCAWLHPQNSPLILFAGVVLSFLPFFLSFEHARPSAAELMPVVVLAALAAVGRILFAPIPNCKPVTAIVMIAGAVLGRGSGFLCGALAALASNIFFGQGAWTPWQMFAWGLIGYVSGVLAGAGLLKSRILVCLWSFLACLLYGAILDSWYIVGFVSPLTWKSALAAYGAGLPFSLLHGVSSVIFSLLLFTPWSRILGRIQTKYL